MSKAIKGCVNPECIGYKKRITYKAEDDKYCVKCGSELKYVCRECWMILPNGDQPLCLHCQAEHDDKWDKPLDTVVDAVHEAANDTASKVVKFIKNPKIKK